MARRQAAEGSVDQLAVDCGQHEFLGGVLADHAHWVLAVSSRSSVGVLRERRRSMSVQMFPAITVSQG